MNKMNFITLFLILTTTLSFAAEKKTNVKSASKTKDLIVSKEVTGQIKWTGFGVGKSHSGVVKLKSGVVDMKNENIVGGVFVFDMSTLDSTDSKKLVNHLKSEDFFAVEKFNTATFKITKASVLKSGADAFEITGDLTIKDKTQPITFNTVLYKSGDVLKASGKAEIEDRTKYDIVYNSKQFSAVSKLGDKLIEDNIKIQIDVMTK